MLMTYEKFRSPEIGDALLKASSAIPYLTPSLSLYMGVIAAEVSC